MVPRHDREVGLVELTVDGAQPAVERHVGLLAGNGGRGGARSRRRRRERRGGRVHQRPLAIGRRLVVEGGRQRGAEREERERGDGRDRPEMAAAIRGSRHGALYFHGH